MMKTFCVITPKGELVTITKANTKAHARRLFLGLKGESTALVNKRWTQYKRQGFNIVEQLHLNLFDK